MSSSSSERFHMPQGFSPQVADRDLLRRLRRTLCGSTVVIQSPNGTGKTVLLSCLGQYLQDTEARSAVVGWMSVSPEDLDSRQFKRSLARALAFLGVGLRNYDEVATTSEAAPELAMIALADDVIAHPDDVVLLVDDVEQLSEASAKLLWQFINAAQETLQVAIACTPNCAFLTVRRPAHTRLAMLSAQELMFGLQLPGPPEVEAALETLSGDLREALMLAAPLASWSEDGLRDLGIRAAAGWLPTLQAACLPVLQQGGEVVPAALLRHLLLTRLAQVPEVCARQHVRAGRRLAMQGRILEAVQALTMGGELRGGAATGAGNAAGVVPPRRLADDHAGPAALSTGAAAWNCPGGPGHRVPGPG